METWVSSRIGWVAAQAKASVTLTLMMKIFADRRSKASGSYNPTALVRFTRNRSRRRW